MYTIKKPSNEKEYAQAEKMLDHLIDEIRDNENHPLVVLLHIIGDNMEEYDNKHGVPIGHDVSDKEN